MISEDGGASWRLVALPAEGRMRAIALLPGGRGLVVGGERWA
jgi:hypothetical protein